MLMGAFFAQITNNAAVGDFANRLVRGVFIAGCFL